MEQNGGENFKMFYQIKSMIQQHRIQFEKNISKELRYNTPSESSFTKNKTTTYYHQHLCLD
jgi:hypothetical protein